MQLTLRQARALALESQGLSSDPAPFGTGDLAAHRALEHLGYVQIDTIAVIERAHHHVLWTRDPGYLPARLDSLLSREKRVYEYWSHAASYLPISGYRHSLPRMQAYASGERHWFQKNRKLMRYVLDRIRAEGPLSAKDFAAPENHRGGKWFEWKPAKIALEQLFMEGRLTVSGRKNFQKVYDLPERFLPPEMDLSVPAPDEHARFRVLSTLRAHGLAQEREITYLRASERPAVRKALEKLRRQDEIVPIRVDGLTGEYFVARNGIEAARGAEERLLSSERVARLLSPFDNAVIQRRRLQQLFGFDYQIECYVPEPKRRFGYFVLPILWGDRFVGRLDPKADRQAGVLRIRSVHLEPDFRPTSREKRRFDSDLSTALDAFARFNGCERVAFDHDHAALRRTRSYDPKRSVMGPSG